MLNPQIQLEVFRDSTAELIVAESKCQLLLDERLFKRRSRSTSIISFWKPEYVYMPTMPVNLHLNDKYNSTSDCLTFQGSVVGFRLHLRCLHIHYLDITTRSFELAKNVTELHLESVGRKLGRIEPLDNVRIDILKLSAPVLTVSWLNQLARALNNSRIRSLSVKSFKKTRHDTLGAPFFLNLQETGLRELYIQNIGVDHITPQMIGKLNLTTFQCQKCGFTSFPIDVIRLQPHLEALKLSENEIFLLNLTEVLRLLPELRFLDLSHQGRSEITGLDTLAHSSLATLNLAHNKNILERKTANFSGLVNLRNLDVSACSNVFNLQNLTVRNLVKLTSLIFDGNGAFITRDVERVLQGLPNLKKLSLKQNYMRHMYGNLSRFLRPVGNTLETLYMAENKIEYLDENMFRYMKTIQILDMSHNRVKTIPRNSFSNSVITNIDLRSNLIETLDVETFNHLPFLRRLFLSDNKFHCDCDLIAFQQWTKDQVSKRRLHIGPQPKCYAPAELKRDHVFVLKYVMPWIACDHNLDMVVGAICAFVAVVLCIIWCY